MKNVLLKRNVFLSWIRINMDRMIPVLFVICAIGFLFTCGYFVDFIVDGSFNSGVVVFIISLFICLISFKRFIKIAETWQEKGAKM